MASSDLPSLVRHLRQVVDPSGEGGLTDPELIARWLDRRDEVAFEVLVLRHGPMVLGVCRRMLRQAQDAEDAFQATFLTLARKAATIADRQALAGWLHQVARRIALHARTRSTRRSDCLESLKHAIPTKPPDAPWGDVRPLLDEEIGRLPEKYRLPVVLCYLEGRTTDEAALLLGCPRGTIATRLARARERLRARLGARGIAPSLVPVLDRSLVQAAVRHAGGTTSPTILALADEALKPLLATRIRAVVALSLATAFLMVAGAVVGRQTRPDSPVPTIEPKATRRKDLEGVPLPAGVLARMGSGRLRHTGAIRHVTFTPDGKSLPIGGDFNLRLWDVATGRLQRRFDLNSAWLLRLAFSADGRVLTILEGYDALTCQRLDYATGLPLSRFQLDARNDRGALSPAGERLAVADRYLSVIRLYDTASGKETLRIPFREGGLEMAFAPGAASLALADGSDTVRVLDTTSCKTLLELRQPGAKLSRLVLSPDGRSIATVGGRDEKQVTIWDLATGKERHRLPDARRGEVHAAFSGDGRLFAAAPPEGPVSVVDLATGKEVRRLGLWPCEIRNVLFSPDGKTLATILGHGTVLLWDVATGKQLPTSADPPRSVNDLRFDRDGARLVGQADRWLAWDAATGRVIHRFPAVEDFEGPAMLSPDERLLAVATPSFAIRLVDAATGRSVRTLEGHSARVSVMRFSPDGRRLFSAGRDKAVRVWEVATGRLLHRLEEHLDVIGRLAVSPDGRQVASATYSPPFEDFAIRVWDVTSGRLVRTFTPRRGSAHDLAFSPDGRLLAAVGGKAGIPNKRGEVQVWDIQTGKERGGFEGHAERVTCVAFSPDGKMLATGSIDRTVRLWEVATGGERHRYLGHEGEVHSLAFGPDGRRIAAASSEAPVYVWEVGGGSGTKPSPAALLRAWQDLLGENAHAAYRAICLFATNPDLALPFVRDRLKPVAPVDPEHLGKLLNDLDSSAFLVRERATAEVEKLASRAEGALRRALAESASPEVRRRLRPIVAGLEVLTPEMLRASRALEALERMETAGAAKLLQELAGGAEGALLTREAAAARMRMLAFGG